MNLDIRWSSDLSTGIQQLDQQHKQIFELLRQIEGSITSLDAETLEHLVIELLDFIVSHNHLEDQLMERAGYPHAAEHKASHQLFTCAVEGYMQQMVAGTNPFRMARQVHQEVGQWLEAHLIYEDQSYANYMKSMKSSKGRIRRAVGRLFSL